MCSMTHVFMTAAFLFSFMKMKGKKNKFYTKNDVKQNNNNKKCESIISHFVVVVVVVLSTLS